MTYSEARAHVLALRFKEATELATKVNKHGYNWLPLVKFLHEHAEPRNISRDLKTIYYDFVDYTLRFSECGSDDAANGMYVLRCIIEAIAEMQNLDEENFMEIGVREHGLSFNPESKKL